MDESYSDSVAILSIRVDDDVLQRARSRAATQGRTLDEILNEHLAEYAGGASQLPVRQRIVERALTFRASSGVNGRDWSREGLYDRYL